jgi:uridine phosphorylase
MTSNGLGCPSAAIGGGACELRRYTNHSGGNDRFNTEVHVALGDLILPDAAVREDDGTTKEYVANGDS